jgi:hypothetical protein
MNLPQTSSVIIRIYNEHPEGMEGNCMKRNENQKMAKKE